MNKPLKIGITGGIGSGKTTVTKIFEHLAIPVYQADERAKWLMQNNTEIRKNVIAIFGKNAYQNNTLNRKHIAAIAFTNKDAINALNQIVHPIVFHDFFEWYNQQKCTYIIKEAALLFESKSYLDLDAIVTIDAPMEVRISRTIHRDNIDRESVINRIKNQLPDDIKNAAADYIILNDGKTPLLPQVLLLDQIWKT
ncbi:MAG: dephospho-CoA kinase [Bacteroidia bacterium]|nr:dephospho-CoA kinase [Bacteroidia bacterium]